MSYTIQIFSYHEINRDLATILGNAAKTGWPITPKDISTWLDVQKNYITSWKELHVEILGEFLDIYQTVFPSSKIKICTLTLKA